MDPYADLSDDELAEAMSERVHFMQPAQVSVRLGELQAYARPTRTQHAEIAALEVQNAGFAKLNAESRRSHELGAVYAARLAASPGMAEGPGIQSAMAPPSNVPPGTPPAGHGGWATAPGDGRGIQAHRTAAMRTLDHYKHTGVMNAAAADRADRVLRHGDGMGMTARYLAAAGNEAYHTAFAKMVGDPQMGHLRFSSAEVEAVREASAVQDAHRIMGAALTTGSTGFILPITWDPSIILTGQGALFPIRDLASVVTIGTHDWEGVSADSVTASYVAEGVEATDATPTLAGPKIRTQQGRAFCQFTLEAAADWETLSAQLVKLVDDARHTVDATMLLTGTGTNQPFGIFGGDATYSLTTTQRVLTTTIATYAVADPWLLKAQIPPRFINSTTFAAAPTTWDTTYQFVAQGSTTAARQFSDGDRGGDFLGRPKVEWSTMATGAATGTKLIAGGDWTTAVKIVDRMGMQAELIPHMVGAANRLPIGVRGLYCWWRSGAGVVAQNALRYLEVK
jgi:HK97 family phage major capsid protein